MLSHRPTARLGLLVGVLILVIGPAEAGMVVERSVAEAAASTPVPMDVFLKTDEALKLAFPKAKVTKERSFLSKDHKARVAKLAGVPFDRGIINAYVARDDKGVVVGTAYFDNHKVRTKRETLMFVVDPSGKLARVEVLAFGEPREYMPSGRWFAQLVGQSLTKDLAIKGDIKNLSGATLSAKVTVSAARRVLATHQLLEELRLEREKEAARKATQDKAKKDGDPTPPPPKDDEPQPTPAPPPAPAPSPTPDEAPPKDGEDPDGDGGLRAWNTCSRSDR